MLPVDKSNKEPKPGDLIVAVGGRTGRDGIHGATFSSAELTSESESLSGGAVQIGNAITEKMVLDVVLQARDRGLYNAITDCGAGGFSSAVGEMGEKIGAVVWLDRVPLKYSGLSYTEIWISEAQERMVLVRAAEELAAIESTVRIRRSGSHGHRRISPDRPNLQLLLSRSSKSPICRWNFCTTAGRRWCARRSIRRRRCSPSPQPSPEGERANDRRSNIKPRCYKILGSLNVCSKEWIIRQYDHEVQGGSVIKPLVGVQNDGPSDAAVLRPVLSSRRGIVISCGMNPRFGDFDTYHMAASAIDEAVRNCVAVGADPARIAILDNFCWGDCERPETLGSLVRAALGCSRLGRCLGHSVHQRQGQFE